MSLCILAELRTGSRIVVRKVALDKIGIIWGRSVTWSEPTIILFLLLLRPSIMNGEDRGDAFISVPIAGECCLYF